MSLYDTIQEEGKDQGIKLTLLELLKIKFSEPIPEEIKEKIEEADRDTLSKLRDKIFEIESLDDVRELLN